jgi:hypothetical protein
VGGPGNVQPSGYTVYGKTVPSTFAAQLQFFDNVISRVRGIGKGTDKETAKHYECFQDVTALGRLVEVLVNISVRPESSNQPTSIRGFVASFEACLEGTAYGVLHQYKNVIYGEVLLSEMHR